jgi:ribonuclease P protein subunit POP4
MAASKNHIAHELLSRAHSPDTADQLFTERIKQKPLFLRPTSPTPADNRSRRRLHRLRKKEYFYRNQKPRPLSAREKRISGIHDIPKEECKYEIFKGLHKLWVEYMQELLDIKDRTTNIPQITAQVHGTKLASADFHGAEIEVVRSRCAGRVGTKGIVVRDTKFTLVIITEKDVVKSEYLFVDCSFFIFYDFVLSDIMAAIPKEHTVFRFTLPTNPLQNTEDEKQTEDRKDLVFELHGSQFENRPVDRANKKFKWKNVDYL